MEQKKRNYGRMKPEELSTAVNLVKSLGVPMYNELATTLVQQGIIVQAGLTFQDSYNWASTEPIHISKVSELVSIVIRRSACS